MDGFWVCTTVIAEATDGLLRRDRDVLEALSAYPAIDRAGTL